MVSAAMKLRCLLLGRKVMTNLNSILKSTDITLPTKVHLVKALVSPVVMYGCESCTIKKAECQRIDDFELWCWRRLMRVTWTAKRSNQPILKEISPEYSLEGLMLKLKLQYFNDWRWEEKGMTEHEMVGWHHQSDGHEFEQVPGVVMDREAWRAVVHGVTKSWTRLNDWIELNWPSASEFLGDQVHYQWVILLWKKIFVALSLNSASLVAQMVKNLPAMQETQVWSLGRENPQEKRMATHSSIFAWRIPWTEEPGGL